MKNIVLVLILTSLFLFSCDGYQQSPVRAEYISSLNTALVDARQNGAKWINSPEDIARHYFPPISHDGGPKRYELNKKMKSATDCIVTILEEGAIDDEVSGERYTIHFQTYDGHWTIADLKLETKRRQ